jgi:hypothetical protein
MVWAFTSRPPLSPQAAVAISVPPMQQAARCGQPEKPGYAGPRCRPHDRISSAYPWPRRRCRLDLTGFTKSSTTATELHQHIATDPMAFSGVARPRLSVAFDLEPLQPTIEALFERRWGSAGPPCEATTPPPLHSRHRGWLSHRPLPTQHLRGILTQRNAGRP